VWSFRGVYAAAGAWVEFVWYWVCTAALVLLAIAPALAFDQYGHSRYCVDQHRDLGDESTRGFADGVFNWLAQQPNGTTVGSNGSNGSNGYVGFDNVTSAPRPWCGAAPLPAGHPLQQLPAVLAPLFQPLLPTTIAAAISGWTEQTRKPFAMYAWVQEEYWNVGFLRYYELKQVPNFLLASPMLVMSVAAICHYARCLHKLHGLRGWRLWAKKKNYRDSTYAHNVQLTREYEQRLLLPMVCHWGALVVVALLFMHVQVLTRFVSAAPPLYWYAAKLVGTLPTGSQQEHEHKKGGRGISRNGSGGGSDAKGSGLVRAQRTAHTSTQKLVLGYFVGYTIVGTVMFCNFFPWT
jgi:hypothetical protein